MKVKDLIEELQKYPEDMEVFKDHTLEELPGNVWNYRVKKAELPYTKMVGDAGFGYAVALRACEETSETKKCVII